MFHIIFGWNYFLWNMRSETAAIEERIAKHNVKTDISVQNC